MATQKRHVYTTGTENVSVNDFVIIEDVNYYNSNNQSVMRSIVRFYEDIGRRFDDKIIYDGLALSGESTSNVTVASGSAYIGGRWWTIDATNLSVGALADDTYNVIARVSGVSESNSRDPSSGESVSLLLEADGSYSYSNLDLVLGNAVVATNTVSSITSRAQKSHAVRYIKPYEDTTTVSILAGTAPVFTEVMKFESNLITSNVPLSGTSTLDIAGAVTFGSTLDVTGTLNVTGATTLTTLAVNSINMSGDFDVNTHSIQFNDGAEKALSATELGYLNDGLGANFASMTNTIWDYLNNLSVDLGGLTATATELNYLDGATAGTALTTGNEGSGGGIDADTVDGSHASAFATSGHGHSNYVLTSGDTMTGRLLIEFTEPTGSIAYFTNAEASLGKKILTLDFDGDSSLTTSDEFIVFRDLVGQVGAIHSEVVYDTFTAGHKGNVKNDMSGWREGMILSSTGISPKNSSKNNFLPYVELSSSTNDRKIIGVFMGINSDETTENYVYLDNDYPSVSYHAIGEGKILVTNADGDINNGDYVTTNSAHPGIGVMQADDILHSYTVAKITEDIDWDIVPVDDEYNIKLYLAGCTYHCG